jgi:hypothetical protein
MEFQTLVFYIRNKVAWYWWFKYAGHLDDKLTKRALLEVTNSRCFGRPFEKSLLEKTDDFLEKDEKTVSCL